MRMGGFELGRMNPRKLSTKDRERFGNTSREVSRSPAFVSWGLETDGEQESSGRSSASANGLAALELPRDPVTDEHWEVTIGESNKSPGLGTTTPSSTLVMQSSASTGGPLSGCGLRADMSA